MQAETIVMPLPLPDKVVANSDSELDKKVLHLMNQHGHFLITKPYKSGDKLIAFIGKI